MLLSSTYFGPIQWYAKLFASQGRMVRIEAEENFIKQTFRNRCVIATANGQQALTIPVAHREGYAMRDITISDHGNWQHLHWQAIKTAYGESAFFEYYQDFIRPFYIDEGREAPVRMKYLLDYNIAGMEMMCRILDIDIDWKLTEEFVTPEPKTNTSDGNDEEGFAADDWRYSIRPKNAPKDSSFTPVAYYQVYAMRNGFLPNLSIMDLLFNEGPQAVLTLSDSINRKS